MNGPLVAMGGAVHMDGAALTSFYDLCGGPEGRVAILPTASVRPEAGKEYAQAFQRMGLRHPAVILPVWDRAAAEDEQVWKPLGSASGLFIMGGNQARLPAILGGTRLHDAVLAFHQSGKPVGGTSAGATVLSSVMIMFGKNGSIPRERMARMITGLGLTNQFLFDLHFSQRYRLARLIYAVAANPGLLGVGVDEDTAAVIEQDRLRVVGRNMVTIVDGSTIRESDIAEAGRSKPISVSGVTLHVLGSGCSYHLHTHLAEIPLALENLAEDDDDLL